MLNIDQFLSQHYQGSNAGVLTNAAGSPLASLADLDDAAGKLVAPQRFGVSIAAPGPINCPIGVVELGAVATTIRGQVTGGTSVTINVRKNGSTTLLAAPLTINAGATWTQTTVLQNVALVAGDYLELQVITVTGTVAMVAAQLAAR